MGGRLRLESVATLVWNTQALLKREGYRRFVPLEFSLPMIEMLLDYFQRAQAGEALPTIAANEEPARKGLWNKMTGWLRA